MCVWQRERRRGGRERGREGEKERERWERGSERKGAVKLSLGSLLAQTPDLQ